MPAEVHRPACFPPAAAARICAELLNRHSPHEIASAIEVLIDLLDLQDGDPDAEVTDAEDDFFPAPALSFGPGCEASDPGGDAANEDEPGAGPIRRDMGPGCPIADPGERDMVP